MQAETCASPNVAISVRGIAWRFRCVQLNSLPVYSSAAAASHPLPSSHPSTKGGTRGRAHLPGELVGHLAEDGLERAAGAAAGRRVQHHHQALALVVQLAQRKLPAVPIGRQIHVLRRGRAVGRRLAGLRSRGLRGSSKLWAWVLGYEQSPRGNRGQVGHICSLCSGTASRRLLSSEHPREYLNAYQPTRPA